ncbi:helix-turn-helix domain-containing protein [Spiribacter sp. 221]|uniref:hypothetical protein n=1 Tax=Spiribacter onubensis TaxID=3122420 RepID=UPI00349F94D8
MNHSSILVYWMRQIASETLPMEGSNIPVDICLAVACHYHLGDTLTIKGLVSELPYSEAGVQYNLRDLREGGWVTMRKCPEDGRVRRLVPSEKLEEALESYWQTVAEMVDRAHNDPDSLTPRMEHRGPPRPVITPPEALWANR